MTDIVLRDYQQRAIDALRASLASGKRRPMLQIPTGGGKTAIAGAVVQSALGKGRRVAFVVPYLGLIDQTVAAFERQGIGAVGVIQAFHPGTDGSQPVQVCSIQTLARRKLPEADLIIVDEAHRQYKFLTDWMRMPEWLTVPFIGLSATPWSRGLGKQFDDLIIGSTMAELIEQGHLCKFEVFAPAHPDLSNVRTVAGDYHEGDLSEAMSKPTLVADVVEPGGNSVRMGTPSQPSAWTWPMPAASLTSSRSLASRLPMSTRTRRVTSASGSTSGYGKAK